MITGNTTIKIIIIGSSKTNGKMECTSNNGMDNIRTIGMSQTKAVGWIRLNCLMLKVNVVSVTFVHVYFDLYIVLLNVMKIKRGRNTQ